MSTEVFQKMAKHEDLKNGVWVRVIQPHALDGMVLGPLPADAELPPEEQSYIVAIMPSRQYHRQSSLELIDTPKLRHTPVVEQLREHAEAFQSNPNDPALAAQLIESLKHLGFLKPKNN
jgi:hypothetical protein